MLWRRETTPGLRNFALSMSIYNGTALSERAKGGGGRGEKDREDVFLV